MSIKFFSIALKIVIVAVSGCSKNTEQPNIILIMADDLGWGDVGFNGNEVIKTPALDEMAENGVVFTRFYAAAPVCSPTRGSCLTGRHPFRYGVVFANRGKMPPEEITLAEYLKEKGYATGHFGKWHLGTLTNDIIDSNRGGRNPDHYSPPWENGFDVCFSTEAKVPTWDPMFTPDSTAGWLAGLTPGEPFGTSYWSGPGEKVTGNLSGSNARIIMDRVISFIDEQTAEKKPFFTVVWFHTPHQPVVAGEEYLNLYDEYSIGEQHYYGVVSAMDEQIGRLNRKLKELNSDRNTLIFFTSDNGPEGKEKQGIDQGSTGGFRGRKRSLYEGGIRTPGFVVWPDKIKGGRQTDFPAVTSDYFPTILDILGEKGQFPISPVDGISLVDVWKGKMDDRPFPIGFQSQNQKALIDNRHKLVQISETFELYDLLDDPFEITNIAGENTEIVNEMKGELNDFIHSCEESVKGADYN